MSEIERMSYEDFKHEITSNPTFLRRVVRLYFKKGTLQSVAISYGLNIDAFDVLFSEYPEMEDRFNDIAEDINAKASKRTLSRTLHQGLESMAEIVTDAAGESERVRVHAMSTILQCYKLISQTDKGGSFRDDELDDLWKSMENEFSPKENTENYG